MTFEDWLTKTGAHPDRLTIIAMRDAWFAGQQVVNEAWNVADAHSSALAMLRELNDALVVPGWLQPRVDAVLDRAEGEPTEPAIRPTEEAANAFWRYWKRNGIPHVHGFYESTWGAINAALRTSGVVQHRYGSTLKEMLNSGHPPQRGTE